MASGIPRSKFVSNLESKSTRKYSNEREREGEGRGRGVRKRESRSRQCEGKGIRRRGKKKPKCLDYIAKSFLGRAVPGLKKFRVKSRYTR